MAKLETISPPLLLTQRYLPVKLLTTPAATTAQLAFTAM
jgi:hypothetical protein